MNMILNAFPVVECCLSNRARFVSHSEWLSNCVEREQIVNTHEHAASN